MWIYFETIATIYWRKELVFFPYTKGVTFKLISSSLLVRDQCRHFPFRDCKPFAIHLEEYGCMANLCNYYSTLSSLPYSCLTSPPSYFSTLPPPYFNLLPSLPSVSFILRFDFLCFNTKLKCFLFVRTDRPDHSYHNENFTFNQNYPARSVSQILNSLH